MAITSLGVIGFATASASDTVNIPVTVDVPRSDPVTGGSFVIVTLVTDDASSLGGISFVADDADTDPFYNTCLFADGLNHYTAALLSSGGSVTGNLTFCGSFFGLILNPLFNGFSTITVGTGGIVLDYLFAFVTAYTGVNMNYSGTGPFATLADLFAAVDIVQPPVGEQAGGWNIDGAGVATPASTSYTIGDLALLWQNRANVDHPSGAVAWSEAGVTTVFEADDQGTGGPNTYSLAFGELPITVPQTVNNDVSASGWWGFTDGGGGSLRAGPGPICTPTPPAFSGPVFDTMHRAVD